MQNLGFSIFITFCLIFTVLPALDHFVVYQKIELPQKNVIKKIEAITPKVLTDLKVLEKSPIFTKFTYTKNAELVFSENISWSDSTSEKELTFNRQKLRKFAEKYKDWRKNEELFQAMLKDPEIHQIDTSWMSDIRSYDHWNLTENAKMNSLLKLASNVDTRNKLDIFHNLPIPDFFELRSWALTQLLKEHKNVNSVSGLENYRHIAFLSYTTGTLIGGQIAAQMLNDERILTDRLGIENWPHYEDKSIQAFKRLTYIWPTLIKGTIADNLSVELSDYFRPEFGICSAVFDASNTLRFRDLLEPRFILESAHSIDLERFDKTYEMVQKNCNSKAFAVFSNRTPASFNTFITNELNNTKIDDEPENLFSYLTKINIAKIPYIRRIFAAMANNPQEEFKFRYYE